MFGIGGSELVVIAIVLLIAVGPSKLPKLIKGAVRGYRDLRRATRDLRASTGIDDILRDEDLKDLGKPLRIPPPSAYLDAPDGKGARTAAREPVRKGVLQPRELLEEDPIEGVDVVEAEDALHRPDPEEAARIRAAKEAAIDPEEQAIIRAKNAAAGIAAPEELDEEARAIVDAKNAAAARRSPGTASAAAPQELDEEARAIVDAKNAAAGIGEARNAAAGEPDA